jgi:hypothetical protein
MKAGLLCSEQARSVLAYINRVNAPWTSDKFFSLHDLEDEQDFGYLSFFFGLLYACPP